MTRPVRNTAFYGKFFREMPLPVQRPLMVGSAVVLRSSHRSAALLSSVAFLGACTLNEPRELETGTPSIRPDASRPSPSLDASVLPPAAADAGGSRPPVTLPFEEELPTGCSDGATLPCGPSTVSGICKLGAHVCNAGVWSDCRGAVYPSARRCDSKEDNDCDGQADDTVDAVCACAVGSSEPCDTEPRRGNCKAGERRCVLAPDGQSSAFGACEGAVEPLPTDSCAVEGDDANCDGTPNGGCNCVENKVITCGPPNEVGICKKGTSVCVNSKYTPCEGAVEELPRDCRSPADNNCDGQPDDAIDASCSCVVGTVEVCGTHADDGRGLCKAGERACVPADGNSRSVFGQCVGSVGPELRRCNVAADADCDGRPDNTIDTTCACAIGSFRDCDEHPGFDFIGRCRPGRQGCLPAPDNTSSSYDTVCRGSTGPAAADLCTVRGDDSTCDGIPNGGCGCLESPGNERCPDPAASRCDIPGVCGPCRADADCALIAGAGVCDVGRCVECTTASSRACTAAEVCDPIRKTCVARGPVDAGAPRTTR